MARTKHPNPAVARDRRWPEGAIVYHIYPRSFQDSSGDGVGDLQGVISRLDYLQSLSVTAIWLSPFYPSPMADFGYDVADYCAVDPLFGTLGDFKQLLAEAAARNIKVIIDLVPNHTSDEHKWFKQSRLSKDNPYGTWYIWRDPESDTGTNTPLPPNNWRDVLAGGPAWEWEPRRKQFYLHSFNVKQPDLNWGNPAVREAIKGVMRFWLDLGVDGFRMDAVYWLAKEPLLSDDPPNPEYVEGEDLRYNAVIHDNSRGWPPVYAYLNEMAAVLKEKAYQDKQRFMVTEAYPSSHNRIAEYMAFYVGVNPEVAAPFNFEGVNLSWEASSWRKFLKSFHSALEQFSPYCVPSYAFGNHDVPRLLNRLGQPAAARSAAIMLLTLPGMVFVYYGEEIGMHNVSIPPQHAHDPAAKGDPLRGIGRDPERTPMQWTADKYAGFTTGDNPWLPLATDSRSNNVEVQSADPDSFLSLYRTLGKLRQEEPALKYGGIEIIDVGSSDVLGYIRRRENSGTFLVLINFSNSMVTCRPGVQARTLVISNYAHASQLEAANAVIELQPYEGMVFSLVDSSQ